MTENRKYLDDEDELGAGFDDPEADEPQDLPTPAEEPPEGAEEAPEEPAEDAEADSADDEEDDARRDKTVPYGALKAERERRKERERELQELRSREDRINRLLESLAQRQGDGGQRGPEEQEPRVPDPETEPFEYMTYTGQRLQQLEQRYQQLEQSRQAQARQQQFLQTLSRHEEQFSERNPDYYDRVEHVRKAIRARYDLAQLPAEQAEAQAQREMLQIAVAIAQRGADPAQAFHEMAETKFGYRSKAPASRQEVKSGVGRQKFKSMSDASGSPAKGMDMKKLADMDVDEMEEYLSARGLTFEDFKREVMKGS